MNPKEFGLRLKELRLSHQMTQTQLANQACISRQAYIHYESGHCIPPADIIARLSVILDFDLMELLYNHTSTNYANNHTASNLLHRDDIISLLDTYSKLPPLAQKRVHALVKLLYKGGDK